MWRTRQPSRHTEPSAFHRAGLLAALALAVGLAPAGAKPSAHDARAAVATDSWAVDRAVTTIGFNDPVLATLGLSVTELAPSASGHLAHPLFVAPADSPAFDAVVPAGLRVLVTDDSFLGFAGGALRHRGGFQLRGRDTTIDFAGVVLRPGTRAFSLELLDASGEPQLGTAQAQWELDATSGELRYLNADLRILPALARRLGDPRLTGITVGVLAIDARLQVTRGLPHPPFAKAAPPCGDWSGTIDVALTGLDSVGQNGPALAGRIAVVPSVTLKNTGTANVPWYSKFSGTFPPYGNDQHPFLTWQMVRTLGGVLEPLGRNGVKHAFATGNLNCVPGACTNTHILGLGCEDTYGFSSNSYTWNLGPRAEIAAATGRWAHCNEPVAATPSFFDPDADCVQDQSAPADAFHTFGATVATSALDLSGARYFVEAFYVVRNDVDIFDSMGFREVDPALLGSTWVFTPVGDYQQGPVLDAWVNPAAPGPDGDNKILDTGAGHLQLAARVTADHTGRYRYAFALQNHDFDRRIWRFRVTCDTQGISAVGFSDGDASAANDWTATVDAGGITWTAPAGATPPAELDWASLMSFRFDTGRPVETISTTLGVFEPGLPTQLGVTLFASTLFADAFESGGSARWSDRTP